MKHRARSERYPSDETTLSRRQLLTGGSVLAVTAGFPGCSDDDVDVEPHDDAGTDDGGARCGPPEYSGERGPSDLFQHGVASGDPLTDAVILWTRVTAAEGDEIEVHWQIAMTSAFSECVSEGTFSTDAGRDFTVKVDASGLEPGTTYYYRFHALGRTSPVGRTRTAPADCAPRLRFAVVSCSSLGHGYFHSYRAISKRADLDAVIHLGDYIYEYGTDEYGDVRPYEPAHEIVTLADYRMRHSQYKRDADLQAAHRQHPFIAVWDDHEVANNAWEDGATNHQPDSEGEWTERKAAAQQAYSEWMPIRDQEPSRVWRRLSYGDLVDLILLDTRLWGRDETSDVTAAAPPPLDPGRTILGDDQADWMEEQIRSSSAQWKLVCQQVMLGNLNLSADVIANLDQWHGYPASRQRFIRFLRDSGVENVVVLTGDIHSSWANEIVIDPLDTDEYDPVSGAGSAAVEFVTPAITSPGIPDEFLEIVDTARPFNPHVKYFDLTLRGYLILDVTPERTQSAWYLFDDIVDPDTANESFASALAVEAGRTTLVEDDNPADPPDGAPALAP